MSSAISNTYGRLPVAFTHGKGVWLWDTKGRRYLDAMAGIGVSCLGHAHPKLVAAISEQAARVIHVSNLYEVPEQEELAQAYGKGATGRGMATGAAKAVKELEKEQKSRSTRMVRDSIDGALLDIATFYRDVMMVQSGNTESMINTDMREDIEGYASSHPEHSTILKINALMEARANLARNAAPLVTCEALMCQLARK